MRAHVRTAIVLLLAAGLLFLFLRNTDLADVATEMRRARPDLLVLSLLVTALTYVLRAARWHQRLLQLVVPFVCIAVYLLFTESGLHERAVQQLVMPVTTQGWLLILPYALLVPVLLWRDPIQAALVARRLRASTRPDGG